jgi:hypothetical protein
LPGKIFVEPIWFTKTFDPANCGCDLLDADDTFIEDISADLIADGSSVEHNVFATIHRLCTLRISRELVWGSQRVRPWLTLSSDGVSWVLWPLGVFVLTTPETEVSESPRVFEVQGYDKLQVLDTPLSSTYSLAAGDPVIAAVEALIAAAGETSINIDQTAAATVAAGTQTYSILDEEWTTLRVCNDLLDSIGYRGLWCDENGAYRSEPYRSSTT